MTPPLAPLPAAVAAPQRETSGIPLAHLVAQLPQYRIHGPIQPLAIQGLACHTDLVRPGTLFACVPGTSQDGHAWAEAAVARGAAALLVAHPLPQLAGVPQVEVPDVRSALAMLSRTLHGYPDRRLLVLAVTGTNGKTTTTFMLQAIFAVAQRPVGLIGTVCYRLGQREVTSPLTTPDAPALHGMLAEIATAGLHGVALEASSHALAQKRLEGLEVDTAVFTNLSRDHLDYHGNAMAYFAAKRRLFRPRGGSKTHPALAVVCTDTAAGRLVARESRGHRRLVTFGIQSPADVRGHYRAVNSGAVIRAEGDFGRLEFHLGLPGAHNAQNALAAVAAALGNGVHPEMAAHALEHLPPIPGRFEPVMLGQDFEVVVDFAHNPAGLAAALQTARRACRNQLRLVFGCKGGDRDSEKRSRMGELAGRYADHVYLTTDDPYAEDPAAIAAAVSVGLHRAGARWHTLLDRRAAVAEAIFAARPGDLVLVAGRGHETRQAGPGGSVPLDDRALCRTALAARLRAEPLGEPKPGAAAD